MFLIFLFRSAPEEGLYCKPKYRAKKFVFLKNKYISVILAFVVCSLKLVTSAVGISLPLIFSNLAPVGGGGGFGVEGIRCFDHPVISSLVILSENGLLPYLFQNVKYSVRDN